MQSMIQLLEAEELWKIDAEYIAKVAKASNTTIPIMELAFKFMKVEPVSEKEVMLGISPIRYRLSKQALERGMVGTSAISAIVQVLQKELKTSKDWKAFVAKVPKGWKVEQGEGAKLWVSATHQTTLQFSMDRNENYHVVIDAPEAHAWEVFQELYQEVIEQRFPTYR
jgi:hypothetical protein